MLSMCNILVVPSGTACIFTTDTIKLAKETSVSITKHLLTHIISSVNCVRMM